MPPIWEYLLQGGNVGIIVLAVGVMAKVHRKLVRDEDLKRDYPPHRHINGTRIIYPQEYQPTPIEQVGFGSK